MTGGLGENLLATSLWEAARAAHARIMATPHRTLFHSMQAVKKESVRWLSREERRRLQAALADQVFFDEVIALSAKQPTDELVTALGRILDGDRPEADAVEYAELLKTQIFTLVTPQLASAILAQKTEEGFQQLTERLLHIEAALPAGRFGPTAGDEQAVSRYVEQLLEELERDAPKPFGIPVLTDGAPHEDALQSLLSAVDSSAKVALTGDGGAGKSTLLRALAAELLEAGAQVILLDLARLPPDSRDRAESGELSLRTLVSSRCSPQSIPLRAIRREQAARGAKTIWLLDGLNEVPPRAAEHLVEIVLGQDPPPFAVVVTDRREEPTGGRHWSSVRLCSLEERSVATCIDEHFGEGTYGTLDEATRNLLSSPFFLDLAIRGARPLTATTQFGALDDFVRDGNERSVVRMPIGDILTMGRKSIALVVEGGEPGFNLRAMNITTQSQQTLMDSGTLTPGRDGRVDFRHQLLRDYFLAHGLVQDERLWTVQTFDAVSNQANDIDSLLYATQLLKDRDSTDQLLTALHDWNWFATVRCLWAASTVPNLSRGIALAISAMLAIKQFEVVKGSATRAREWTRRLDDAYGWTFGHAVCVQDVLRSLEAQPLDGVEQGPWFHPWKETFLGRPRVFDLVARLNNGNPLIAWAAANVLRLKSPTNIEQEALRATYAAALADAERGHSVRWRVVHALAQWKSADNTNFLFEALDNDPYMWVQYGAVRGLMEAAAEDPPQRGDILEQLRRRLPQLGAEPASQLFWASRHSQADDSWPAEVRPLLEAAVESSTTDAQRSRCIRRLAEFDAWAEHR